MPPVNRRRTVGAGLRAGADPPNVPVVPAEPLRVQRTDLEGLWVVSRKSVEDDRGVIRELYRESDFVSSGLPSLGTRPQTNCTETRCGALRGIHGERIHKLVAVLAGAVHAVIVVLRRSSPTAGHWLAFDLLPGTGLFVSAGLGNSSQATSEEPSQYVYVFSEEWQATCRVWRSRLSMTTWRSPGRSVRAKAWSSPPRTPTGAARSAVCSATDSTTRTAS